MPTRADITYFGAGPALLPTDIATKILEEAKADLTTYLDIPSDYEILFMQAGGSGEFSATVYNFVGAWVARQLDAVVKRLGATEDTPEVIAELRKIVDEKLKLDYLVTGGWSQKSSAEAARLLGSEFVNVAADARKVNDGKFGKIPDEKDWKLSEGAAMVYYCDNETVDGVEFPGFPASLAPKDNGEGPIVVADMSSNILSRRVPVKNYSAIFFGAQKNLGLTGVTVVVIKKSLLAAQPSPALMRKLGLPISPIVLSYETIAKNNSLYNTLSIFDVYVAGQVLKKLLRTFPDKAAGQEAVANKKASLIYTALEAHPDVYRIVPDKSVRSRMNICFRVTKGGDVDATEKAFLKDATSIGLTGLKGHRSVGGIRASNYNSIPLEGAEKLAAFIESFAKA
uniref:phosphoserine transaminase n=1 Tax=Colletotrichum fructicola (strain Nara gc5) TaxID=1213859 RepID=L2FIQ9_COLFN